MWHIKNNKSVFVIVDNLQSTLYLLKEDCENASDENNVFDVDEEHQVYYPTKNSNSSEEVKDWRVNRVLDDLVFDTKEEAEEYLKNNVSEKHRDRVSVKEFFIMTNHF